MHIDLDSLIGLDFETYGSRPLPDVGLENYMRDPFFTVLIGAVVKKDWNGNSSFLELDFVHHWSESIRRLNEAISTNYIVAHNAIFEKHCLATLGIFLPSERFVDSAMVARAVGAGGKLEAAAPQLLGYEKLDIGQGLIKIFSVPSPKYQDETPTGMQFNTQVIADHPTEWADFMRYCKVDAAAGLDIVIDWASWLTEPEHRYAAITLDMNEAGWPVDLDLVKEMQRRYEVNMEQALADFRVRCDAPDLNLNSLKQMKEWCAQRGIKATSFDEKHVARLRKRLEAKLDTMRSDEDKFQEYEQVLELCKTKQTLGGSSLKKLKVILDNTCEGRLYDQYLHCGAGQTLRTTGRTAQMQNLKRLNEIGDMAELEDPDVFWSNDQMAENLRQVFTSSHPAGELIVGDFASVESRGLAYLAGEEWKLKAYREKKDLYKVLATKIFPGLSVDAVTKEQRQGGKVGELSCGYQAGPAAVRDFAAKMNIEMSEAEAAKLVSDWRDADPATVAFWWRLDEMLRYVMGRAELAQQTHVLPYDDLMLKIKAQLPPASLLKINPHAKTVVVEIWQHGSCVLRRFFHGCYLRGKDICYYKPSELKSGDLWKPDFVNPKTKQRQFYKIYGGKLAGILTQSLCREIFFRVLSNVQGWVDSYPHVMVIGQFHDEIVLDWTPTGSGYLDLDMVKTRLQSSMIDPGPFRSFPMGADIKNAYRYIK
jgi:DNA polymerase